MPIDLSTLNPPQREAVLHEHGPLVVFAGAGSGKTRVIVHRVAHLVAVRQVPAGRILAVTFTNKAADEMRKRLERLVPGAARELHVGTFHATCARLLRRHHDRAGVPRAFVIYDEADQEAMIKRVLRDLGYEKLYSPREIARQIERAKQEMKPPSEIQEGHRTEHLRAIIAEYERRMHACKALDFGDLIYRMVRALEDDEPLRKLLAGRFQHVLVDEFQDTNHAQLRLVLALGGTHRNVCVVGDDDQSIYRWRGADRRNILEFRTHCPDAHVVKLEQNYRSTKRILRAAHAVIARALHREPKRLWTHNEEGAKIDVVACLSERDEADLVVAAAREARRSGLGWGALAVLYRMHAQSRVFEEALRAASIPYRVVGGMRFYDRAEVKDLLAYLRVIQSPEDDVSLLRIINVPPRGIGKTTVDRLLERAARAGGGVYAACKEAASERGGEKLADFVALIESLRARAGTLPLPALARAVVEESGYEASLAEQNTPESDARLGNLAELVGSMQEFVDTWAPEREEEGAAAGPEGATLAAFLERVTLETEAAGEGTPEDSVTLMTVHAAKGLEFPIVIVAGMEEDLFPMRGTRPGEELEELEEERRLAYVAFTRARERLILSWAQSRFLFGDQRRSVRSRFLDELPPSDVRFIGAASPPRTSSHRAWIEDRGQTRVERDDDRPGRTLTRAPVVAVHTTTRTERDECGPLRVGQRVQHARYGQGRIARLTGGSNVEVDFGPPHGKRTIRADYLEPA
jgi:DNA helicase-2/ATP-dependent DNA helicase PcrA